MRLLRNNGVQRFGACLLALSQIFIVAGCSRGGTGGGSGGANSTAAGATAGLNMGKIAYDMLHHGYETAGETGKMAALEKRENDFVGAVNRILPADVGQNLFPTLLALLPIVDDGTLEGAVEDIDAILLELINDPQSLGALARVLNSSGNTGKTRADDGRSMNVLLSRLLAYPEMEELTKAILKLIRTNDGVDDDNKPNSERNLLGELLAAVSRGLIAYQPSTTQNASSITKIMHDLKGSLLEERPMKAFPSLGAPAWAVRLDDVGNPKVKADPATGALPRPYIDADGNGIADVNSTTQCPIDAAGSEITIAPFGTDGTRDSYGRALAPGGDLYFEYFDAKKTFLSEGLLLVGELVKQDALGKTVMVLDGLADRIKHDNGTPDPSDDYETLAPNSPLLDLTHASFELVKHTPLPDLLKGIGVIIKSDPAKFGNLVDTLLGALKTAKTAASTVPAAPGGGTALLNDLLPLLEDTTRPRGRGTSALRALLQVFNTEQRRLQTLPVTFARMMKFSDYRNRVPADATKKSVMHQILDMMVEANQCNAPFAGNMAEFYLNAMAGNQRLLGINISIGTIERLLSVGFLRRLLCSGIKESDVRALKAFNDSGALDAMKPIAQVFSQRGETPLLKDIMLGLQKHYQGVMRPDEPVVVAILESGAVEKLFTVIDAMTQVQVPNKNLVVADALADTLQAILDTGAPRYDRMGQPHASLARLLSAPMDLLATKAKDRGLQPVLDSLTTSLFDTLLATYTDDNGTPADPADDVERWKWEGLKASLGTVLEALGDAMPDDPTDRARWAAEQQQEMTRLLTGRDAVLVIDILKAVAASPEHDVINKALANLFTPQSSAQFDVFGAITTLLADSIQKVTPATSTTVDQQALAGVLHFIGHKLDPAGHHLDRVIILIRKLIRADEGLLLLRLARNALNKGPNGVDLSPVEVLQSVFADIGNASGPSAATTPDSLKETLQKAHDFINDTAAGLPHFIEKIKNRPAHLQGIPGNSVAPATSSTP